MNNGWWLTLPPKHKCRHLKGIVKSTHCTKYKEFHQKVFLVLYGDSKKSDTLMAKILTGVFEIWLSNTPQNASGNISTTISSLEQILKRDELGIPSKVANGFSCFWGIKWVDWLHELEPLTWKLYFRPNSLHIAQWQAFSFLNIKWLLNAFSPQ